MHVCVPGATGLNGPAAASHHPHLELVLTEDTAVQRARVVTGIVEPAANITAADGEPVAA